MRDNIREKKCSKCSCLTVMNEIDHFKDTAPVNDMEAMCLDEILDYGCLQGELFQCYMDANGIKCKGLYDYIQYLQNNGDIEKRMLANLEKYKINTRIY